ncbi:MAG TPA: class I SAM-dependent methyltransferase [Anaeromyxobacter sp.]|nr:class I SAM-dependent methyltransferase [Anaeromyxobacter sp.]
MSHDRNPQRAQMADESMVRNLAFQARAIWPQEAPLLRRYALRESARVLDVGCGTGEISSRLAAALPRATVVGVDVLEGSVALARERHAALAPRLSFAEGDAYALAFPDASFDLVVCRHVLQAIPHAERAVAEMRRVARPGGWLHLLLEDYGLVHASPASRALEAFWEQVPRAFGAALGIDNFVGRRGLALLRGAGLADVRHDDVVVDTLRVPRDVVAGIIEAWRDGYTDVLARHAGRTAAEVRETWDELLGLIRDPDGYFVWRVPIWSGRVPGGGG